MIYRIYYCKDDCPFVMRIFDNKIKYIALQLEPSWRIRPFILYFAKATNRDYYDCGYIDFTFKEVIKYREQLKFIIKNCKKDVIEDKYLKIQVLE